MKTEKMKGSGGGLGEVGTFKYLGVGVSAIWGHEEGNDSHGSHGELILFPVHKE